MEDTKELNLEVCLIRRDQAGDVSTAKKFYGYVSDCLIKEDDRRLILHFAGNTGNSTVELPLKNWFIVSLTWYETSNNAAQGFSCSENYDISPEDQNEAIGCISEILEEDEYSSYEENSDGGTTDLLARKPRHAEITLEPRNRNGVNRRIIVVSVAPPDGHFKNYSVTGRKIEKGTPESFVITSHQSAYTITKIEFFTGENRSRMLHYGVNSDARAWIELATFYQKLTAEEVSKIRNWEPNADSDDYDDLYGVYGGYGGCEGYGNTNYYTDPKAQYRVSGDEEGAKIWEEQSSLLGDRIPTTQELLKAIEEDKAAVSPNKEDFALEVGQSLPANGSYTVN